MGIIRASRESRRTNHIMMALRLLLLAALLAIARAQYDVVILGAGMAGLSAAQELWSNNVTNILIVEQSDRIGGRIHEELIGGQWLIEKGANWVEGFNQPTQNPIWQIGKKIDLQGACTRQESDQKHEPLLYDGNGLITDNLPWQRLSSALGNLYAYSCKLQKQGHADMTMRQALTTVGWPALQDLTPAEVAAEFFVVDFDYEYPPENVSLFSFADDTDCAESSAAAVHAYVRGERATLPRRFGRRGVRTVLRAARQRYPTVQLTGRMQNCGEYFVMDPRGFSEVVRYVARDYLNASGVIRLGAVVTAIDYTTGAVTLQDGTSVTGGNVVTTFSAGVVNAAMQAGQLFSPPMPQRKIDAFGFVKMGVYMKLFLQFPYTFWDTSRDYHVWCDPVLRGYFSWWQNLERADDASFFPAKAGLFMVTILTNYAPGVEAQNDTQTVAQAMGVLRQMYADRTVPDAQAWVIPKWYSDPAFLGSYSNIQVGGSTTGRYFSEMQKVEGVHYFAGEHTDWDYNGFVEGAYRSGQTIAKKIMAARK